MSLNINTKEKDKNNQFLSFWVCILSTLILFTYLQNYYSVLIHMVVFCCCFFSLKSIEIKTLKFIFFSILPALVLSLMAINREFTTPIGQLGFFLHYITWPVILSLVVKSNTTKHIFIILRIIIILCIIGNLASIIVLLEDNTVSRILAGSSETEKLKYYAMGVGGYGYVFAMSFLTFGAVSWLKKADKRLDKALLITFLITNYIFIIYASYTTAIILTFVLTVLSLINNKNSVITGLILIFVMLLLIIIGPWLLELGLSLAESLELDWVELRFTQLIEATTEGDFSSLKRFRLYMMSIEEFCKNPLIGGNGVGGHSEILDALGGFGIFGMSVPIIIIIYSKFCMQFSKKTSMLLFYIIFFIFAAIDTVSTMQIPIVVFFVVPLISNVISRNEIIDKKIQDPIITKKFS